MHLCVVVLHRGAHWLALLKVPPEDCGQSSRTDDRTYGQAPRLHLVDDGRPMRVGVTLHTFRINVATRRWRSARQARLAWNDPRRLMRREILPTGPGRAAAKMWGSG